VNFVKLYMGDYLRDTGTLTLAQHGAYMLMLLEFYATERPLPTGRDLHRLLRADSKAERDAIDFVAGKFWQQQAKRKPNRFPNRNPTVTLTIARHQTPEIQRR
jgi:uncharacterized protein YdaU (DUF1376 family)